MLSLSTAVRRIILKSKTLRRLFYKLTGNVYYISGFVTLPPPLSPEKEAYYIEQLRQNDKHAQQVLIEHNLRLVVYIAKRFENTRVMVDDLISIGSIGLIKAIKTFKPDKKIKLATYASRCIENEILMHLRKNNLQKSEISLDEPLNIDWDGNELLLSDILGTDSDSVYRDLEFDVEKQMLEDALSKISKRERQIMEMRFGLGDYKEMTQKEVADILGISQSYISRLEKKIISRLKREIEKIS